jgi:hypothetical protein
MRVLPSRKPTQYGRTIRAEMVLLFEEMGHVLAHWVSPKRRFAVVTTSPARLLGEWPEQPGDLRICLTCACVRTQAREMQSCVHISPKTALVPVPLRFTLLKTKNRIIILLTGGHRRWKLHSEVNDKAKQEVAGVRCLSPATSGWETIHSVA